MMTTTDHLRRHRRQLWLCGLLPIIATTAAWAQPADQPTSAVAEEVEQLRDAAGRRFFIQQTPHFLIAHDVSEDDILPFIARVEQIYQSVYRFCQYDEIKVHKPDRLLEIIYFNTPGQYTEYARREGFASQGSFGYYSQRTNRSAFFNVHAAPQMVQLRQQLDQAEQNHRRLQEQLAKFNNPNTAIILTYPDGSRRTMSAAQAQDEVRKAQADVEALRIEIDKYAERVNRTVIQHETAHQVLFNAGLHAPGPNNPLWLVEGMAMLFETPPRGRGAGIGAINQQRLADFRELIRSDAPNARMRSTDVRNAIAANRIVPLDTMLTDDTLFDVSGARASARYAQAWSLVHFLQRTRSKEFAQYLATVRHSAAQPEYTPAQRLQDFQQAFGPLNEAFLRRWAIYTASLPIKSP